MSYCFPFGQELHPLVQEDQSPKKVFVLGVYASAVHAKWIRDGHVVCHALAVASEPRIFWDGNVEEAKKIIAGIKIPKELGTLTLPDGQFNGPSAKVLEKDILAPLGFTRSDAWLCDCLPETRLNPGQVKALQARYVPLMEKYGLNEVTVPRRADRFCDDKRAAEITEELKRSEAGLLILLGDVPIRQYLKRAANVPYSSLQEYADLYGYGNITDVEIAGKTIHILPLAHPRQIGKLGTHSEKWYRMHAEWLRSAPDLNLHVEEAGKVMNYDEISAYTEKLLTENSEWEARYGGYYQSIKPGKQSDCIRTCAKCFHSRAMTKYLTIGDAKNSKGTVIIDLRFLGHSIGRIKVDLTGEIKNAIDKAGAIPRDLIYASSSVTFNPSGLNKIMPKLHDEDWAALAEIKNVLCREGSKWNWHCREVQALRNILWKIRKNNDYEILTEHTVETLMLRQLKENRSEKKNLIGIQPCLLDGCFYQLCTPLKASDAKNDRILYGGRNGGGIDILARIRIGSRQELCVIELKDEYTNDERPIRAVKQAIAYAAFLDALIRSEKACGDGWYRDMFGATSPNSSLAGPIVINAVAAMPFKDDTSTVTEEDRELAGRELILANGDKIRLHYMFFRKEALNSKELVPGGIVTSLPLRSK